MNKLYLKIIYIFLFTFNVSALFAQQIRGVITDSLTSEPLMYISVFYEGKGVGSISNIKGEYVVENRPEWKELTFSAVGYNTKVVRITPNTRTLNIKLAPGDILLNEVVIKPKKERYSRKNNPAVDFMRKVIENKSTFKLQENDYYQFDKYQKMKTSFNDMTPDKVKEGIYKKIPNLENQLEPSPNSDKQILPLSIQETASSTIYRRNPKSEKTIMKGMTSNGIQDFLSTGDMLATVLQDVFSDVNIYDNDIRLLQERFVSPISNSAISFYKYYLMDTLVVDRQECVHLTFVPQNSQDFGFTGHLYVVNDSSYAVKRCTMNLPKRTGVNFVENMDIIQQFEQLPDGNWVLTEDDMIVDLFVIRDLQGVQVQRTTRYSNYSFDPIPNAQFKSRGNVIKESDMLIKDEEFWADARQVPLTQTESNMAKFVRELTEIPGFKYVVFALKTLFENYIETTIGDNPSKFDIGPINTTITSNYIDGLRLRFSGRTTAQLHPQLFLSGYGAYGFKDKKWKYEGTVTYAFHKQEFFPWEFPKHNISFTYKYDVMSPMDKFLATDKDNVFVSWKIKTVDQMSYVRDAILKYEVENNAGLGLTVTAKHRNDEPAGNLKYFRNNSEATFVKDITTTELGVTLEYAPGRTYVNTKQRRIPVSLDMPVFRISHTAGFKNILGGEYNFNLTEASIFKRFFLSSWGRLDATIKAGAQWNKVPFPLLILPEANLSYISQPETFSLINNMEFFNDRFASLSLTYNMNGKLFNRIPLIKKLKWRELFRVRMLWGDLTDKNNPYINNDDSDLFRFPTRNGEVTSFVMDPKTPYIEASFGIHNIFKLLNIEYVRRLNYLDNPGASKHGIRLMIMMSF